MLSMDGNRGSLEIQLTIEAKSVLDDQRPGIAQSELSGVLLFGDRCATLIRFSATLSLVAVACF